MIVDTPPGAERLVRAAVGGADATVIPTKAGALEVSRVRATMSMVPDGLAGADFPAPTSPAPTFPAPTPSAPTSRTVTPARASSPSSTSDSRSSRSSRLARTDPRVGRDRLRPAPTATGQGGAGHGARRRPPKRPPTPPRGSRQARAARIARARPPGPRTSAQPRAHWLALRPRLAGATAGHRDAGLARVPVGPWWWWGLLVVAALLLGRARRNPSVIMHDRASAWSAIPRAAMRSPRRAIRTRWPW